MKISDKQAKSLFSLSGLGLGMAIAAQGSLSLLVLGLGISAVALVGIFWSGANK